MSKSRTRSKAHLRGFHWEEVWRLNPYDDRMRRRGFLLTDDMGPIRQGSDGAGHRVGYYTVLGPRNIGARIDATQEEKGPFRTIASAKRWVESRIR